MASSVSLSPFRSAMPISPLSSNASKPRRDAKSTAARRPSCASGPLGSSGVARSKSTTLGMAMSLPISSTISSQFSSMNSSTSFRNSVLDMRSPILSLASGMVRAYSTTAFPQEKSCCLFGMSVEADAACMRRFDENVANVFLAGRLHSFIMHLCARVTEWQTWRSRKTVVERRASSNLASGTISIDRRRASAFLYMRILF